MEHRDNRRNRYILTGVLIVVAVAFGIERCTQDSPEEEPPARRQTVRSGTGTPIASTRKAVGSPQQEVGKRIYDKDAISSKVRRKGEPHTDEVASWGPHISHTRAHYRTKSAVSEGINTSTSLPTTSSSSVSSSAGNDTGHADNRNAESDCQPAQKQEERHLQNTETTTSSTEATGSPTGPRHSFCHRHLFRLGLRAGTGYSKITGLGSIVESYNVRPTFTMEEKGGIVPRIGIFGTWQYRRLGAELGVDYTRLSSKITEHKLPQDVTETTKFHYDFLAPQLMFRFYAFPKFYMGAGISAAVPFGSRHIDFSNDRNGQVYRQQAERTQDHLRESLKARVLFMPSVKIGFADPRSGLEAGIEYGFGLNDLLRTRPNDYSYQERKNNVQYVSFTIGYSLPLNKKE
ncbi:hypothetical protein Premu_1489 [Hallella multisaccharivorax DSM 17128]|uniref:Outer membrane protein beta-barrel domain-containing protein n=1 Tax=Hallella multisaccharivorax DSM 17128 TaxID=688246 RepID=F8NBE8_9BACT|nr:hypothetical protein [Hallella multisaccharivorax]EGN56905.1 hypothetical protein Premu_1489 [Hallella multisaccharivorax DSM 17128]